jgi:adenine-specific DNA methylase
MSKYYQTSKKKFISENNKEKWDERFRQATARCDYCLEFKIGIEKKSKDKEVKDKHLLSFLTGNENETDFICNTCIAYSFFRKIISIVKKIGFFIILEVKKNTMN